MKSIGEEVEFKKDGIIQMRAKEVLGKTIGLLEQIQKESLFTALEKGIFAGIKRSREGGKGLNGVFIKADNYYNPFIDSMLKR